MANNRFVVIGADAAGMSAASLLKRRRPEMVIEAFEMGRYTSYGACGMPYFVAGLVPRLDDLVVVSPREFEEKRGIKVHTGHQVRKVSPEAKTIEVLDLDLGISKEIPYDYLMISTGAEPIIPGGLNPDLPGVFTLRGLADAGALKAFLEEKTCRQGIVVGSGYIGMEMAEALVAAGLSVTVLGRSPRVMPTFESEISAIVEEELVKQGVTVVNGAETNKFDSRSGGLAVGLTDGRVFPADVVVVGAGVRPRSQLAREAGLALGIKGAIKVDRTQRTSNNNIWAGGDCAEAYHLLLKKNTYIPLALTANRAGRIAGSNIAGIKDEFPGILGSAVCKIFDLTVARTGLGLKEAQTEGIEVDKVVVTSRSRPHYYPGGSSITTVLIVDKNRTRLWGAQMTGRDGVAQRINTFAAALAAGMTLDQIHNLDLAYAPPYSPVWDPVLIATEVALKESK